MKVMDLTTILTCLHSKDSFPRVYTQVGFFYNAALLPFSTRSPVKFRTRTK